MASYEIVNWRSAVVVHFLSWVLSDETIYSASSEQPQTGPCTANVYHRKKFFFFFLKPNEVFGLCFLRTPTLRCYHGWARAIGLEVVIFTPRRKYKIMYFKNLKAATELLSLLLIYFFLNDDEKYKQFYYRYRGDATVIKIKLTASRGSSNWPGELRLEGVVGYYFGGVSYNK